MKLIHNGTQKDLDGKPVFELFTIDEPGSLGHGATFIADPGATAESPEVQRLAFAKAEEFAAALTAA